MNHSGRGAGGFSSWASPDYFQREGRRRQENPLGVRGEYSVRDLLIQIERDSSIGALPTYIVRADDSRKGIVTVSVVFGGASYATEFDLSQGMTPELELKIRGWYKPFLK
jgi:hypothetical protein